MEHHATLSPDIQTRPEDTYAFADATYRKVALRFIPFLMLCYVVAYLDRVNIGIAKLNMLSDLQFSEAAYGLGAGLFFIGYMLFEVPSNLIMHRVGARRWIARIMISWGLLSGVMAFVTTPWQFYTVRFLLGVAEAGFYPGVILYLTYWFPNRRRAKVTAIFQAGIPIAGLLGSPLSGWILERFHLVGGHAGWQWVFVLEALPTLPLAVGVLWILTDRVKDAKWLTPAQRQLIENDIAQDDHGREHMPLTGILRDMRICKIILMTFPAMMALYTLGFYLPTLIKDAGAVSGVQIGLLSAIPYCVAVVAMVLVGRSSDRHGERRWHLAGIMLVGAFGLVASVFAGQNLVLAVISLSIAAAGIISFSPIMWTLPTAFLGGATAAACIGAINSLANLGGFVSPYLIGWIRDTYHSTAPAIFIIAGALVAGALIALSFDPKKVNR
ncbi:putative tartrate transporter [Cupriavidus taiwanensis]|uniref:Tartrate transporter n=1 Tax=Cupriavidus taiwanensis TaxID=164546 RepID=A0A375E2A5_9BURK|nr:MFS transporter [Cupriavidus taiwanensis]SOZ55942.1 putative tartrate transporter [Cupriavidus taiwanensis]SOZ57379.1 putative tartrate transporter [Cupriavidus taiwanensis]SOZ59756.1 putative tartrate transporter [Cupriavidus taiwanensis]SPA05845.1 putative tartrate transporter [Cupriavidus taiwanensis]